MSKREEYINGLANKLRSGDEKLEKLERKIADLSDDAKAEAVEKIEDLKSKKKQVLYKLDDFKRKNVDASEDIEDGVSAAVDEFDTAIKKAMARF